MIINLNDLVSKYRFDWEYLTGLAYRAVVRAYRLSNLMNDKMITQQILMLQEIVCVAGSHSGNLQFGDSITYKDIKYLMYFVLFGS
jgi:hypothetical protein